MEEKWANSKNLTKIVVSIFVLVLIVIGGAYAWLRIGLNSQTTNKIKAGMLDLRIDE